jgi:hypothetical protein
MNENTIRNDNKTPAAGSKSYQVNKMTFIVEPVFRDEGDSLGDILFKLMRDDAESANPTIRRHDKED